MAASDHDEDDRLRVSMPFASIIPMVAYTADEDDEDDDEDDEEEDEVRTDVPNTLSAEAIAAGVKPESYSNPPSAIVCNRKQSAKTTGLNKKESEKHTL